METVVVVIAIIVGARWWKRTHRNIPASASYSGAQTPIRVRRYTSGVPVPTTQPGTEACFHQYDTGPVIPAITPLSTVEVEGQEYVI